MEPNIEKLEKHGKEAILSKYDQIDFFFGAKQAATKDLGFQSKKLPLHVSKAKWLSFE